MAEQTDSVAVSILRMAIEEGDVDVIRHGGEYIGVKIVAEWYGTPEQADLLERLLVEEEKERRPDLYEEDRGS